MFVLIRTSHAFLVLINSLVNSSHWDLRRMWQDTELFARNGELDGQSGMAATVFLSFFQWRSYGEGWWALSCVHVSVMAGMLRVSYKWRPACEPTLSLISVMFLMGDHKYAIVQMGHLCGQGMYYIQPKALQTAQYSPERLTRMTWNWNIHWICLVLTFSLVYFEYLTIHSKTMAHLIKKQKINGWLKHVAVLCGRV